MFALIGPGRYNASTAERSSNFSGIRDRRRARIGEDSNWNTPIVSPRESNS